jgi:DNA/RNA-binding domain of Phe-tRNA-synthetase-like protein
LKGYSPVTAVHVDSLVAGKRPQYRATVVVAEDAARGSALERAADDSRIAAWRAVFSEFGSKPSKYPSSAESLLARVLKGDRLPRINAFVDTYNAVSLRHVIPVGGEDLDAVEGDLRLTREEDGEVVWRDDAGVTCGRWNWRQGERTRLSEATRRAFFVFDALEPQAAGEPAAELIGHLRARSPGAEIRTIEAPSAAPRPA